MEYKNSEPKVTLPYIEQPEVITDRLSRKAVFDQTVSGFTEEKEMGEAYNYEYYRYHWVGNSTPPSYTYYADFFAMVSGAVHMEIKNMDGKCIAEEDIPFTETVQKTPVLRITADTPYTFSKLNFIVRNYAGIEASEIWTKNSQETGMEGRTAEMENRADAPLNSDGGWTEDKWEYPLMRLTWSMTSRCNQSCRHCAFRDIHNNMTELSGSEIRGVVTDILRLGVQYVSLSGGEVLMSPYWYETAKTLSRAGVEVSLITNGTLIDRDCAVRIKEARITRVSVSIDDLKEQRETIRQADSYGEAFGGIKELRAAHVPVSIVTTVNALNLQELHKMRRVFTESGADTWCIKPILPIGEAARNPKLWLDERDINKVTDFCYSAMGTEGLPVVPALSFEMNSKKGAAVLRYLYGEDIHTGFCGCDAGIFSAQLHPDGSLVGICMCSPSHAAGNVKERSLAEIWQDKRSFKALREFDPSMLSGYCKECSRRDTCKGGDLGTRLAFGGIYGENKLCAYRNFKLYGITI